MCVFHDNRKPWKIWANYPQWMFLVSGGEGSGLAVGGKSFTFYFTSVLFEVLAMNKCYFWSLKIKETMFWLEVCICWTYLQWDRWPNIPHFSTSQSFSLTEILALSEPERTKSSFFKSQHLAGFKLTPLGKAVGHHSRALLSKLGLLMGWDRFSGGVWNLSKSLW